MKADRKESRFCGTALDDFSIDGVQLGKESAPKPRSTGAYVQSSPFRKKSLQWLGKAQATEDKPKAGKGHWVTMGGHDCDPKEGKHCGGSPVHLKDDGTIDKGPKGTIGKKPDELESRPKPQPPRSVPPSPLHLDDEGYAILSEFTKPVKPKPKPKPKSKAKTNYLAEPISYPKNVKVTYKNDAASKIYDAFGVNLSDEDLAALANGVDGGELKVNYFSHGNEGIALGFKGGGVRADREIYKNDKDELVCHNDFFEIDKKSPHKGSGYQLFANQVKALQKMGVKYIETHAAGVGPKSGHYSDEFNGYITWPKLGYDGEMSKNAIKRLPKDLRQKLGGKTNVQSLMALPGGKEAWEQYGSDIFAAKFDLSKNSKSMKVLEAYIAKRKAQEKSK